MDDPNSIPPAVRNDLRAALQLAVTKICVEEDDSSSDGSTKMSPAAVLALSELLYLYISTCLAKDLSAFCTHAGRKTISESDVLLVARKNPEILKKLQEFCGRLTTANASRPLATAAAASRGGKPKATTSGADTSSSPAPPRMAVFSPSTAVRPPLESDDDDDSSSDSSLEGTKVPATKAQLPKPAAVVHSKLPARPRPPSLSSDSDDIQEITMEATKPPPPCNKLASAAMDTATTTSKTTRAAVPPKRFRLPSADAMEESDDGDDDDDDNDDLLRPLPPRSRATATTTTAAATTQPLTVQDILETMSQDST